MTSQTVNNPLHETAESGSRQRVVQQMNSTEFQRKIGKALDDARYEDQTIMITKHRRPFAVLMSIREYDRYQQLAERFERRVVTAGGRDDS